MNRLIAVLILSLVAAGCSSSTPAGSTDDDAPPAESSSEDFLALAKQGGDAEDVKIVFRVTTAGAESNTITWARRGEESAFIIESGGQAVQILQPGDGSTVTCVGGDCLRSEGDEYSGLGELYLVPFQEFSEFLLTSSDLPGFAGKGSRTIAGRPATCASWSYLGGETEVCVDNVTGVTLLWSVSGAGETATWEVTELGEPTDADFELDGAIVEIDFPEP